MSRPISPSEVAVLERALKVGASQFIAPSVFSSLHSLQVTASCKCGCGTLWFGPKGDTSVGHMLADALAYFNDQSVQLIVWSQGIAIVGLEVVGPGPMPLPPCNSVRSYSEV